MSLQVDVQRASTLAGVPPARQLKAWARATLASETQRAEISVRVVDEPEGADLNGSFRGADGATNVLSFPFDAPERTDPPLLGDVVICAPVVAREAHAQGKPADAHFAHMVVHGTLHLLGHDHLERDEAERMEGRERAILAGLGFADPYAESVT